MVLDVTCGCTVHGLKARALENWGIPVSCQQLFKAGDGLARGGSPFGSGEVLHDNERVRAICDRYWRLCVDVAESYATLYAPLRSAEAQDRLEGIDAVAQVACRSNDALPALCKALADHTPEIRAAAAEAIGRVVRPGDCKVAATLAMAMEELDPRARAAVVEALVQAQDESVVPTVVSHLAHYEPSVRASAASALGRIAPPGHSGAGLALCRALGDPDPHVQQTAFGGLCCLAKEDGAWTPALLQVLSAEPLLALRALPRVSLRGSEVALAPARELLSASVPCVRVAAIECVSKLGGAEEAFAEMTRDEAWEVRRAAVAALRVPGNERLIADLLRDPAAEVRHEAASILATGRCPEVVDIVLECCGSQLADVRCLAVGLLGQVATKGAEDVIAALVACSRDASARVRQEALSILPGLVFQGDKRVVDAAQACVDDETAEVRQAALAALSSARTADGRVAARVKDRIGQVGDAAVDALRACGA